MDPVLSGTVPAVDPDRSEADPAADPELRALPVVDPGRGESRR